MNEEVQFLRSPTPLPEWRKLLEVCEAKGIKPDVVVRPKDFREDRYVAQRAAILRSLREHGWTVPMIREVCPLKPRQVYDLFLRR